MGVNSFDVQFVVVNYWFECVVDGVVFGDEQFGVVQVVDVWCKVEVQQVYQVKYMIGEFCCIGVVFFDVQVGFVVQ